MKVLLELSDLSTNTDDLDLLARIFGTIVDGWHEWVSPDPDDSPLLETYFARYPQHRELAVKAYTAARAYPSPSRHRVRIVDPSQADPASESFTLKLSLIYLSQPLRVLVENEISDGQFYRQFLSVVDPDLVEQFDAAGAPAMFDQGGGLSEIENLVTDRAARAHANGLRPRAVVIADSDARYPGHRPGPTARLIRTCNSLDVAVHVTEKRSQENYMPNRIIEDMADAFADCRQSAAFILALSSEQRDHYHIKSGMDAAVATEEVLLYRGVSFPATRRKLPRLSDYFRERWGLRIEEADLDERTCIYEFEAISALIRKEL